MDNLEEALRNIDVFCRVLVKKIIESEKETESYAIVEPMEKLIRRRYVIEEKNESTAKVKGFIPLPHVEEPLIDIFEEDNYVKVLMQCRCRSRETKIQKHEDFLQICLDNECWKLNLPVNQLKVENIAVKCNNNEALEVIIPKA
ncbi:MAG: hypothetical protein RMJ15_09405 [Nitrososphaerota archaeon]|nr:hypothetical protein [Candidatus Bathyarchaeota archaeon]MDW8023933.1 hypothetical protein [Nitrososphaerota archaeon]